MQHLDLAAVLALLASAQLGATAAVADPGSRLLARGPYRTDPPPDENPDWSAQAGRIEDEAVADMAQAPPRDNPAFDCNRANVRDKFKAVLGALLEATSKAASEAQPGHGDMDDARFAAFWGGGSDGAARLGVAEGYRRMREIADSAFNAPNLQPVGGGGRDLRFVCIPSDYPEQVFCAPRNIVHVPRNNELPNDVVLCPRAFDRPTQKATGVDEECPGEWRAVKGTVAMPLIQALTSLPTIGIMARRPSDDPSRGPEATPVQWLGKAKDLTDARQSPRTWGWYAYGT